MGRDLSRDPAVQSVIEIASCASLKRDQVLALARRLLSRRAFYDDGGQDWADILYTYLVISHAWADLSGRFAKSAQRADLAALAEVKGLLRQLIGQSADALGIDRAAPTSSAPTAWSIVRVCRAGGRRCRARLPTSGEDAAAAAIAAGPERPGKAARPRSGPGRCDAASRRRSPALTGH